MDDMNEWDGLLRLFRTMIFLSVPLLAFWIGVGLLVRGLLGW